MKKLFILSITILMLIVNTSCTYKVFHEPTTVSTKSRPIKDVRLLEAVNAKSCDYFILFIPIPLFPDYPNVYDELLKKAKDLGGNAVVDFQWRSENYFSWSFPPIVVDCWEAVGTAAVIN